MAKRDQAQQVILLAMLVLGIALVAGVFIEGRREQSTTGKAPERRVSLMEGSSEFDGAFVLARPLDVARMAAARRFDYPLGSENGAMSYDASPFLQDRHLGADLNGIGGWDSDLGDPVYAAAEGRVTFAGWAGDGWGNFVMVGHRLPEGELVQTIYGHLESIGVAVDDRVFRGRRLGTVGKGAGQYLAHLHFEVREGPSLHPGLGYADSALDRLAPEAFLEEYRGAAKEDLAGAPGAAELGSAKEAESFKLLPGERPAEGKEETVRELRQ